MLRNTAKLVWHAVKRDWVYGTCSSTHVGTRRFPASGLLLAAESVTDMFRPWPACETVATSLCRVSVSLRGHVHSLAERCAVLKY